MDGSRKVVGQIFGALSQLLVLVVKSWMVRLLGPGFIHGRAGHRGQKISLCAWIANSWLPADISVLYSDDEVLELLLRCEWRPPLRRCLPLCSFAGSPWTTPLRASIPPLTEKFRQTMNARIAAFSCASPSDS